jgi:type I restriction enzyme M protein
MEEIKKNGYNLNISRYVSLSEEETSIDLEEVNAKLAEVNARIKASADKHNAFLQELGLSLI